MSFGKPMCDKKTVRAVANMKDKSDTYMNNQSLPKQHKCCSVPATKHSVW